jgi:hypothetical protein
MLPHRGTASTQATNTGSTTPPIEMQNLSSNAAGTIQAATSIQVGHTTRIAAPSQASQPTQAGPSTQSPWPLPKIVPRNRKSIPLSALIDQFEEAFENPSLPESLDHFADTMRRFRASPFMKRKCLTWETFLDFRKSYKTESLKELSAALPSGSQRQSTNRMVHVLDCSEAAFDRGQVASSQSQIAYTDADMDEARKHREVHVEPITLKNADEERREDQMTQSAILQSLLQINKSIQGLPSMLQSIITHSSRSESVT